MLPEDDVSITILPYLFDGKKPFSLIEVPYCEINETASKNFTKKFQHQFQLKIMMLHQFSIENHDVASIFN